MTDREQIARDIKLVNGTEEGERLISYFLRFCHVHQDSWHPKYGTEAMLFNEGQRSVGNEIIALLYNEPDRFKATTVRKVADQAEGTDL